MAGELRTRMMDRGQTNMLIGAEIGDGKEVYKGGGIGVIEHVIVNPETQDATYTRLEHPYFTEPVHITSGLKLAGILRKSSLFSRRRLVEIDESGLSVQKGDKLQLSDGNGEEFARMKVRKDWGAFIRAAAEEV